MKEKQKQIFQQVTKEVSKILEKDFSGHDMGHTLRVYDCAMYIAQVESADEFLVGLTALLHDVDDYKVVGTDSNELNNAVNILMSIGIEGSMSACEAY